MKAYDIRLVMKNGEEKKFVAQGKNKRQAYNSVIEGFEISIDDIDTVLCGVI